MGTKIAEDVSRFDKIEQKFGGKPPKKGGGALVFAGTLWPARTAPGASVKYHDVEVGFREARSLAIQGVAAAAAALRGEAKFTPTMAKWFGTRPTGPFQPAGNGLQRDWWLGAYRILCVIESFVTSNINLYYRGDSSLIGKAGDYPGDTSKITARDVGGYAESSTGSMDNVVGLCSAFFAKRSGGQVKMNLTGFDCVGGTLIHELSHNLCKTDDHDSPSGGSCYGTAKCIELAANLPRRAWYNADNIEYFCEEIGYGVKTAPTALTTGAVSGVSALKAKFGG